MKASDPIPSLTGAESKHQRRQNPVSLRSAACISQEQDCYIGEVSLVYTPHTVTLYNATVDPLTLALSYNVTLLTGVFLDIAKAANVEKTGLSDADNATLFIPFSVTAADPVTGTEKQYAEPKDYEALTDKSGHWTLNTGGKSSGVECFFVKGNVVSSLGYKYLREHNDYVFNVSTVDIRDFGSEKMRHWQVGGR